MINNLILIRSGVDTNSREFKEYYKFLKDNHKKFYYLDFAVENNSPVLSNPPIIIDEEYRDYKVDDISFIWKKNEIIGHQVTTFEKLRPVIPLGMSTGNHLDMDRVRSLRGRHVISQKESFCKNNCDLHNSLLRYYESRKNGKLESMGMIKDEEVIKKR